MLEIKLFTDGGIRKGIMALGFIAEDMNGNEIFSGNHFCGSDLSSSNVAEYRAVIAGLKMSLNNEITIIHIYSDSQLVVKQIIGAFKTNKPTLKKHRDYVLKLLEQFDNYTIKWVPRNQNKLADALVNAVFERRDGKCEKKTRKQRNKDMRKRLS